MEENIEKITSKEFRKKIESVGRELVWKFMSSEKFITEFVQVATTMSNKSMYMIISRLDDYTFGCWIKKLWHEQDIQPDPDNYRAAYDQSKPILEILKNSLLIRITVEQDNSKKLSYQQQLGLVSLILDPKMVSSATGYTLEENEKN